jgi:hypothetical protein
MANFNVPLPLDLNEILRNNSKVVLNSDTPAAPGSNQNVAWQADEFGNLSANVAAGGSGTPGGSDTQLQYNNSSTFAGAPATVVTTTSTDYSASGSILIGPDPTIFTNWSEFGVTTSPFLVTKSDPGLDLHSSAILARYQLNDENVLTDSDSIAGATLSTLDWIRNSSYSGMEETFGILGLLTVHGDGTNDDGNAFGSSGQVFVDGSVNTVTGQYSLLSLNTGGSSTVNISNVTGFTSVIGANGTFTVGTYTGIDIETDGSVASSGGTIEHSRGIFINTIPTGTADSYQIYSAGLFPSYFAGPIQLPYTQAQTVYSAGGTALPSAVTAGMGARAFVSDAQTTTFGAAYVGGYSGKVPVYSDGTNWLVG